MLKTQELKRLEIYQMPCDSSIHEPALVDFVGEIYTTMGFQYIEVLYLADDTFKVLIDHFEENNIMMNVECLEIDWFLNLEFEEEGNFHNFGKFLIHCLKNKVTKEIIGPTKFENILDYMEYLHGQKNWVLEELQFVHDTRVSHLNMVIHSY